MSYVHVPMTEEEIMQAMADGDEAVRRNPECYVDREFPPRNVNNKHKKKEWAKHPRKIGRGAMEK